jgi:hypothetical protein
VYHGDSTLGNLVTRINLNCLLVVAKSEMDLLLFVKAISTIDVEALFILFYLDGFALKG